MLIGRAKAAKSSKAQGKLERSVERRTEQLSLYLENLNGQEIECLNVIDTKLGAVGYAIDDIKLYDLSETLETDIVIDYGSIN